MSLKGKNAKEDVCGVIRTKNCNNRNQKGAEGSTTSRVREGALPSGKKEKADRIVTGRGKNSRDLQSLICAPKRRRSGRRALIVKKRPKKKKDVQRP